MTFEAQTSFGRKIHDDYALLRLEDVAMGTAAVSPQIVDTKLYFEAKTPVFTPFLTDQLIVLFFKCCRGVGMFLDRSWPIRGGAADIYMSLITI